MSKLGFSLHLHKRDTYDYETYKPVQIGELFSHVRFGLGLTTSQDKKWVQITVFLLSFLHKKRSLLCVLESSNRVFNGNKIGK